jgi:starch synthase
VKDISKPDGCGIVFEDFTLEAAIEAINRARLLYQQKEQFFALRKKIMQLDFSWNASAKKYITMYKELTEEGL